MRRCINVNKSFIANVKMNNDDKNIHIYNDQYLIYCVVVSVYVFPMLMIVHVVFVM